MFQCVSEHRCRYICVVIFIKSLFRSQPASGALLNHPCKSNVLSEIVSSRASDLVNYAKPQVEPTGRRFINFLSPPFFCSGALDSGEKEGGIWLISLLETVPPFELLLNVPTELFGGSEPGGGTNCCCWCCCCGGDCG